MALGGGRYVTQNKTLPGTYTKFVSKARASATLSDRGYAAIALELDWANEGIFTVEASEFLTNSMEIFGYDYTSPKLKGLRDLFKNAKTAYLYCLNKGVKATSALATAAKAGARGNDIKIMVSANVDDESLFDVVTMIKNEGTDTYRTVDSQYVASMTVLVDNTYVIWKRDATLTVGSSNLSGGTNGTEVTTADHQAFLDALESYTFNTLGCVATTDGIKDLYVQYTKRMREEYGVNFQCVVYRKSADYEGVINVDNKAIGDDVSEASMVYWTTGASAGCAVNKSLLNRIYNGEYVVDVEYKQRDLTDGIKTGKFMFHRVGKTIRVMDDINSFKSFTVDKSEDFGSNQTIRVLDQEGNDIALLFNDKYLGEVPNDNAGRMSLWGDIVAYNETMEKDLRAITNYNDTLTTVEQGKHRGAVVLSTALQPVNAMRQLYAEFIVE